MSRLLSLSRGGVTIILEFLPTWLGPAKSILLITEVEGKELLGEISSPAEGTRVTMFIDNGAPVELIEFKKKQTELTDSETRP